MFIKNKLLITLAIALLGIVAGFVIAYASLMLFPQYFSQKPLISSLFKRKTIIGFLPYWLLSKISTDYSPYITDLTYFGLTIDTDGTILKMANEQENEPGWNALLMGKLDAFFKTAKNHNVTLSLLVFKGNPDTIGQLMDDPVPHADNLARDVLPLMKKYGFSDLNVDIEDTSDASASSRLHFMQFISELKKKLTIHNNNTLTVDISPQDFIHEKLIDPKRIGEIADRIVLMTYDYHFAGSDVTGPVAPLEGAGINLEFDTATVVQKALQIIPAKKIMMGMPLYGYGWETIDPAVRSAVIPGTGEVTSNRYVQNLLSSCSTCSAQLDPEAQEKYVIYKDSDTGTYHQLYFPDTQSMQEKIDFANQENLGGVALWALGYEGKGMLEPLVHYR